MKHVLVTGAFGGMGKSVTQALANAGYCVFALDKVVEATSSANVIPVQADLSDVNSVQQAYEKVSAVTNNLYAIVHFAGVYALDSLVEIAEDKLKRLFEVNFYGVYRINKTFLPLLESGSRILITTSELAPLDPLPFTGVYAISKGALDKYAYSLRMELQLLGVKVTVLRPGAVDTGMINVSTDQLETFCKSTTLYPFNAKRFRQIVDKVEARKVSPTKIASKTLKILKAKRPKQTYKINRNPLLLLLNALPKTWQTKIIKGVLKNK